MSIASARSITGCFACKTKRKKCDETKPHCLRCQKSRIECPGYIYIQDPSKPNRKLRTLQAPRTVVRQPGATAQEGTALANTKKPIMKVQAQLSLESDLGVPPNSYGISNISMVANVGTSHDANNRLDRRPPLSSSIGPPQRVPTTSYSSTAHRLAINATSNEPVLSYPRTTTAVPMTSGQASILEALFSLDQPPNMNIPSHHPDPQPTTNLAVDSGKSLDTRHSPPDIEEEADVATHDDKDPTEIVSTICRQPALDKTAQSNALPFVLHSYVTWVNRLALEPRKLTGIARDFVFSYFEDGDKSRLIIGLLANMGSRIGTTELVDARPSPILITLQKAVRWRLGVIKARPNPKRPELVRALDSVLETMVVHLFVSPFREAAILRQEAAPIFRQLCPEPPNMPINLLSLLQQPLVGLQQYAFLDILFSIVGDMPTIFQYEATISSGQSSTPYQFAYQNGSVLQWRSGIPTRLILVFAKMASMRHDGLRTQGQTLVALEREIRELGPSDSSSSDPDPFLVVVRFVVRECWRQVALVYLYMALSEDPCDTPRVKAVCKRFMKLLNGIKPGRLPDSFLILPLLLISPSVQRERDREVIRERLLELHRRDRTHIANYYMLRISEDYWARADAEERPVIWADVAISRKRVLGI